jgi:hypothetical protein
MTVSRARAELNEYFVKFAQTKEGAAILEQRTKTKNVIEINGHLSEKLPAYQHSEAIVPAEIKQPETSEEKSNGN